MLDLPKLGDKVKVWPHPLRNNVHSSHRPVDKWGGGRYLPTEGLEVEWTPLMQELYQCGDLLLHAPSAEAAESDHQ